MERYLKSVYPESNLTQEKTILILTDWYVPGYKAGGPIQSVYNLANLLSRHMKVKVLCGNMDLNSDTAYPEIQANTWTVLGENHEVFYLDLQKPALKLIKQIIKENKSNILYINGLYSFKFSLFPALLALYFNVSKTFISVRGMLHASALSVKPYKKQIFLAFARGFGLYKKCNMLSAGPGESSEIISSLGKVNIAEVPNVPLIPHGIKKLNGFRTGNRLPALLFLGRIAPEKNPLTLLKALKLLKKPCTVSFCGSGLDKKYFEAFESELKTLPPEIECTYLGDVPHNEIAGLFEQHDFLVLPSLGENFGHAIYESMAYGLPVIIGNNTPWKGIESQMVGIETDPNDIKALAAAMDRFISMNETMYTEWSKAARDYALSYFDNANFESVYLRVFK